jgi:chemotaxis protein MotA
VLGAVSLQLLAPGSGFVAIFAGIWLVVGGTVLTARLSHSQPALLALKYTITTFWHSREADNAEPVDLQWFLKAANYYRYGNIRPAEEATRRISEPFLRRGTQMVLDGFPREQVTLALQRQIADERDQARNPVELLRAMGGYSPTLGMLGTLLGLVQMLFGLGSGDMDSIGASMGFAMLTTVYGLVLANLLLKPLASKLERCGRRQTARSATQMQAIMMLYDRPHAEVIREVMDDLRPKTNTPADAPAFSFASR